ncbi:hypothetical protein B0O99DRAFT_574407 [Bisporella sp. PMI_857]|nr:hypothetical protein B0O99DRAFT_574407 [Bisporella sp. PMI_857]
MSKSMAYKHYIRALSKWPKDALRPECQFQDVMRRRIESSFASGTVNEKAELENANILYSLLENRYIKKYPIRGTLLEPASKPTHFTDLMKELEAAPTRTRWQQTLNRWKGMLRFK